MFNNLHNKDLDRVIDLTSAKEIWDRLQLIHEGETSAEKEERGRRKSPVSKKGFSQMRSLLV